MSSVLDLLMAAAAESRPGAMPYPRRQGVGTPSTGWVPYYDDGQAPAPSGLIEELLYAIFGGPSSPPSWQAYYDDGSMG